MALVFYLARASEKPVFSHVSVIKRTLSRVSMIAKTPDLAKSDLIPNPVV